MAAEGTISPDQIRNDAALNLSSYAISALSLSIGADGNLYRSTTDTLKTDDALVITGTTEMDNDTFWVGAGSGLPYGSCYGNEIAWSQASAAQDTWYNISDADMADGSGGLNLITHDGSGKLTVSKAGRYLINYNITLESSIVNKHIKTGIEVTDSGTAVGDGQNHIEAKAANQEEVVSGTAILSLAANDTIQISVMTPDAGDPDVSVDHLSITAVMVGG